MLLQQLCQAPHESWRKFYVYVHTAKGKPIVEYSPSAKLSLFSYCLSRNGPEVKFFLESFNFGPVDLRTPSLTLLP